MRNSVIFSSLLIAIFGLAVSGCHKDSTTTMDSGTTDNDAGVDQGATTPCGMLPVGLSIYAPIAGAAPGVVRSVDARMGFDYCQDLTVTFTSSNTNVATVTASAQIAAGTANAPFEITAVAPGTATITAAIHDNATNTDLSATLDYSVVAATLPTCAGSASGHVAAGTTLTVTGTGTLVGSSVGLQAGASRTNFTNGDMDDDFHVDDFDATIGCAETSAPDGYIALGPAVLITPQNFHALREIPVTIPISLALLPAGANLSHVEVAYTGPSIPQPRAISTTTHSFGGTAAAGTLSFYTPRLGTFQAIVKSTAGQKRPRTYKFRGILGFSMGAMGTGQLAGRHPDLFDFAAPLGGPTDFAQALYYFRNYNFGGFCTEAERMSDPTGCGMGSSTAHSPHYDVLYGHEQDFEHWYYNINYGGQGGTFDRHRWITIFHDLMTMYGNANTNHSSNPLEPNVLPPGVPDAFLQMSNMARCQTPVVIAPFNTDSPSGTGFFDDEFNPDGHYPVVTFCDGGETSSGGRSNTGIWDPAGSNDKPFETFVAVDLNNNGVRDRGEPVIRNFSETFYDFGLDGIPSAMETGYDAVTNPDPAGDDYDFQFNPTGTEGNYRRDGDRCTAGAAGVAEHFLDFGIDGVNNTAQIANGGFDDGEGDGCFSTAEGADRMLSHDPRGLIAGMSESLLADLEFFTDGGIRDLLNSLPSMNSYMGGLKGHNRTIQTFNGHQTLGYQNAPYSADPDFTKIDFNQLGSTVGIRYGDPDASENDKLNGDGGHVGTAGQLIYRIQSAVWWMSARWPDGNRVEPKRVENICQSGPNCPNPNQLIFQFQSSLGRSGPAAVILPPGYYDAANAHETYPVVYFLHGYGMDPQSLVSTAVFFWLYMRAGNLPEYQRLQKMIFVFPDGSCGPGECSTGTFFTDAPDNNAHAPKMETWFLELMNYVDMHYRTRSAQTFDYAD